VAPRVPTTYVTMGDPRGVGPEVALMALDAGLGSRGVRLVGVRAVFESAARRLGLQALLDRLAADFLEIAGGSGAAPARDPNGRPGHPFAALEPRLAGLWAGRSIEAAVRELRPEQGDALVTAPIDKAALLAAGYPYPGHTEMLAALAGGPPVAMMLVAGSLRVSLVTGHVPLRAVAPGLARGRIREVFLLTEHALRTGFDVQEPRIAVCGLNPHAGERGALGDEEERIVAPEIEALRLDGHPAEGPLPADTAFVRAAAGEFDAVLALYHDQGMIPVKLHGFGRGVNVTLGLPFVRTSPDHGTAADLAGTGRARPESFAAALALARDLAGRPAFVSATVYKAAGVQ
jgi:4-hydroxythreonine-4-phosphate dehydrogenase